MARPSRNLLEIHTAVLLFGLAGLFGKLLDFSPLVIVFGRVVFAAGALWLFSAFGKLPVWPGSRRDLWAFLGLGILLAVHWTTFFAAVQASSVALALITYSTFPVFVAFLEPLLFRERLRFGDVLLALMALGGIFILVEPGEGTMAGVLWGVASGLTFALLSLFNRKYVRHYSGITIALFQDAFAAIVLLPVVLVDQPVLIAQDFGLLLVLGIMCTAVAHSLFINGLQGVRARTASMISCLEPVYGTVLAILLLDQVPSLRTIIGGLIVLGVAFFATIRASKDVATASRESVDSSGFPE
jgi:drug/metabolite transporter (DMT)-like permease